MTKGEKLTILAAALLGALGATLMALQWLGIRFSGIVLIGVAGLLLMGLCLRRRAQKSKAGLWCQRMFRIGTALVITILLVLEGTVLLYGNQPPAFSADAVLVLGAAFISELPEKSNSF